MKRFILWFIVVLLLSIVAVLLTGCSDTGFEKRATLMPDSVGINIGAQQFQAGGRYCPGISVNAQWNLK